MSDSASERANRVEELLADWELSRLDGNELTPEELANDYPEVLEEVRAGIATLKATAWILDDPAASVDEAAEGHPLPTSSLSIVEFLDALTASGLLTLGQCDELRQSEEGGDAGRTGQDLAGELIERGMLTPYQARTLLAQGSDPLVLDRYIILDVIGSGGMGLVFKALHRSMERVVALKILPSGSIDSSAKAERFRREIRTVAKLSHPNVVAAYDAHEANGVHFLVMEYVAGQNLLERVRDGGTLPAAHAARIIAQVAAALGEAHKSGVIHRDVKPSNVLLTEDGVPKLADLGIARIKDSAAEPSTLTTDGIPVGTIAYMSPEQIHGECDADERSDVYGLGCTLYYLLTGKPLFEKKSGLQVVAAHLTEQAPSLATANEDVPDAIQRVYERMVAKDPDDRFDSMAGVVAALEATGLIERLSLQHESNVRQSDTPNTKSKRWPNLNTIASFAAVGVVAASAFLLRGSGDPRSADKLTVTAPADVQIEFSQTDLARSVLDHDGLVIVRSVDGTHECSRPDQLPQVPFEVTAIELGASGARFDLRSLGQASSLSYLVLSDIELTDDGLSTISSIESLTDLGLVNCWLKDGDLQVIAKMRWLERLSLAGNPLTDEGLAELVELTRLTSLSLGRTRASAATLSQLEALPALAELELAECLVEAADMRELAALSSLRSLVLDGNDVSGDDLAALGGLPDLVELSLNRLNVTTGVLDALVSLKKLHSLNLAGSDLRDEHLARLADLPSLRSLNAEATLLSAEGLAAFKRRRPDVEILWLPRD
ncbi:MAG: protein kinase [Planctomycetota bacterium]